MMRSFYVRDHADLGEQVFPCGISKLQGQILDKSCIGRTFIRIAPFRGDHSYSASVAKRDYGKTLLCDVARAISHDALKLVAVENDQLILTKSHWDERTLNAEWNDGCWVPLEVALEALGLGLAKSS